MGKPVRVPGSIPGDVVVLDVQRIPHSGHAIRKLRDALEQRGLA
jgi:hypothetical protein